MKYTIFPNASAQDKREADGQWQDVVRLIRDAREVPTKAKALYIKLATFGDKRTEKNCLRHDANVLEVHGIEVDYDEGVMAPQEAAERLRKAGLTFLVYTSASHTREAPRWRAMLPLAKPITGKQERADWVGRVNALLGGGLAPESFKLSQSYYYSPVEGVGRVFEVGQGKYLDEASGLPEALGPRKSAAAEKLEATKSGEHDAAFLIGEGRQEAMLSIAMAMAKRGETEASIYAELIRQLGPNPPPLGSDKRTPEEFAAYAARTACAKEPDAGFDEEPGAKDAPRVGVVLTPLSGIELERIDWVWQDGFARGKLHMLAGVAGTGKTTIALNLSAPVTGRGAFPDGRTCPCPGSVVIWSGEDGVADTLAPRLIAAGCDPMRVHIVTGVNLPQGGKRVFDPSKDLESLIREVRALGDVRLLIIEPIVMMAKTDSHKNAETRRDLAPLIDLAEDLQLAVLGITHFSKGTQGHSPVERLTGSLAFGAAPRIVWTTAVDEEDPNKKYLIRAKANICRDGGGFEYQLEQKDIRNGISASYVKWGNAVEGTAKSLLAEVEGTKKEKQAYGNEVDHAKEFIISTLANGPMLSKDFVEMAEANGISERTLKRARSQLKTTAVKLPSGQWTVELSPLDGVF